MIQLDFNQEGVDMDYMLQEDEYITLNYNSESPLSSYTLTIILFKKGKRIDVLNSDIRNSTQGINIPNKNHAIINFSKLNKDVDSISVHISRNQVITNIIKDVEVRLIQAPHYYNLNNNIDKSLDSTKSLLLVNFIKKDTWEIKKSLIAQSFSTKDLLSPNHSLKLKSKNIRLNGQVKKSRFLERFTSAKKYICKSLRRIFNS